ncbi:AsnC family transcriptional regulator [Aeromonas hydrophila]
MTDKFDLLILAELQQDARLPIPELAHHHAGARDAGAGSRPHRR